MHNRRAIGKVVLLSFCWVLSFAGMTLSLAETGWFSFFMQVIVPVALIFGFIFLWQIPRVFIRWPLWITATVFAAIVTLGASFDHTGSVSLVTSQKWMALLYFAGRVPAFYMGMVLLWEAMKNRRLLRKQYPAWSYALVILVCWLPYLFVVWPGTVSNDSITQLFEIYGVKALSNGNPLFQTGLIALFAGIGQGIFQSADAAVAMYVLVQGLLMAWLLGYSVCLMAKSGAPGWLVLFGLLFFALVPVFPLFAWCIGKDTNFAMAVLWLMLIVWRIVSNNKAAKLDVFALGFSSVLCVLLRNAGVALVLVTLGALLGWSLYRRNQLWQGTLYAITSVLAALFIMQAAILPWLSAGKSPETELLSAPLQQVARVVTNETLPESFYADIDAVLPVDALQSAYNGELSDPVKDLWRSSATDAQKRTFFKAWFRLGLQQPTTYFSAFFHNSYGYVMPGYVSAIKPTFLLGREGNTTPLAGRFDYTVNPRAENMDAALKRLLTYAPFRILAAPGLYGWIVLFAFTVVLMTRNWRMLLCMLPALLTLLGCLFSPVNGYFRYAMPVYFSAPLLLTMAALAIRKSKPITL